MKPTDTKSNLWWIALLIGITGLSVYAIIYTQGNSIPPWIFLGTALLLFWWTERHGTAPTEWTRTLELSSRLSLILIPFVAICLSVVATILAVDQETHLDPTVRDWAVCLWCAGILVMLFGHVRLTWDMVREWWQTYRREILVIAVITAVGAFLRLYQLGIIPDTIDGDEGWTGLAALKLFPAVGYIYNNPFSFFEGFGRIHLRLISDAIYIFGQNKLGLRLIPALGGIASIPAVYLFARRLFNVRTATLAAILLALSHAQIHFSRISSVGYIQANWFAPLELYFFLSGLEQRSRTRLVIGGLLLGLHFNFYLSAQILIPLLIIFLLLATIIRPKAGAADGNTTAHPPLPIRDNLRNLGWWFISILIVALPSVVWAILHPNDFGARWAKEGIVQSGWLESTIALTGKSVPQVLLERFVHACKAIFILPIQDFYWAPVPLLTFITAVLFVVGVFLAFRRTRDPHFLLLNGWFWSGVVAVSVLVIPASADSYRLLMVLPAMCILAALGWSYLISLAERLGGVDWRSIVALSAVLAGLIVILNLKVYFLDVNQECGSFGANPVDRSLSLAGDFLFSQKPFDQAYWLGDQSLFYGQQPSTDYLSQSAPVMNYPDPFTGVDGHGWLLFIIIPSRQSELEAVRAFAPGGTLTRISNCDTLSFIAYNVEVP